MYPSLWERQHFRELFTGADFPLVCAGNDMSSLCRRAEWPSRPSLLLECLPRTAASAGVAPLPPPAFAPWEPFREGNTHRHELARGTRGGQPTARSRRRGIEESTKADRAGSLHVSDRTSCLRNGRCRATDGAFVFFLRGACRGGETSSWLDEFSEWAHRRHTVPHRLGTRRGDFPS